MSEKPIVTTEEESLREALNRFQKQEKFSVGDIVRWKKGMINREYPEKDRKAIVMKHLDTPIMDGSDDYGGFREPLDLVLGFYLSGTFTIFYYDSRRFERV